MSYSYTKTIFKLNLQISNVFLFIKKFLLKFIRKFVTYFFNCQHKIGWNLFLFKMYKTEDLGQTIIQVDC